MFIDLTIKELFLYSLGQKIDIYDSPQPKV